MIVIFCNIACRTAGVAKSGRLVVDSPLRLSLETFGAIVRKYTRCISTTRRYEFERKGGTDPRFRIPPGQGWRRKDQRGFPQGRSGVYPRRPGGLHFPYREG